MKATADVDLVIVGSGCSGCSSASGAVGGGSDARVLAMLRRQLHGPQRVSLKTEECPVKLEFIADLIEAGDLSELLPLVALDQRCFDELVAISLAVATRAVPPEAALRGVAALVGIHGIELVHRRLCDFLLDAAIADVSPSELEVMLAAAIELPGGACMHVHGLSQLPSSSLPWWQTPTRHPEVAHTPLADPVRVPAQVDARACSPR